MVSTVRKTIGTPIASPRTHPPEQCAVSRFRNCGYLGLLGGQVPQHFQLRDLNLTFFRLIVKCQV
jgi:hypothetical protein